jgi:23S rRNA pseudouridine2605 synthase
MRLNQYLASTGLGSRRSVESLIRDGQVCINGRRCVVLATPVGELDRVFVSGRLVKPNPLVYLLMNKPVGYEVTRGQSKRAVYDLLPKRYRTLAHVGRLDVESAGLLLFMNDGQLAQKMAHPRYKMEKEYRVQLNRSFDPADSPRMLRGVYLAEGRARVERIQWRSGTEVMVILTQGMNRQVRRIFSALDYKVKGLERVRLGPLTRAGLRPGQFRFLRPAEISLLQNPASTACQKTALDTDQVRHSTGKARAFQYRAAEGRSRKPQSLRGVSG